MEQCWNGSGWAEVPPYQPSGIKAGELKTMRRVPSSRERQLVEKKETA
jgi:hypothetical protein